MTLLSRKNGNNLLTEKLGDLFKMLSDPTRLKIIKELKNSSSTSKKLQKVTGKSQSSISQQLRILKNENIVESKKQGRRNIYSISNEKIFRLLDSAEHYYYRTTKEKIKELNNRFVIDVLD